MHYATHLQTMRTALKRIKVKNLISEPKPHHIKHNALTIGKVSQNEESLQSTQKKSENSILLLKHFSIIQNYY